MTIDMWTHSQIIRDRYALPIQVDGATYYPTRTAAAQLGITRWWLTVSAKDVAGDNVVLTASNGLRFIRVPRHRGDSRPPLYWNWEAQRD